MLEGSGDMTGEQDRVEDGGKNGSYHRGCKF